LKSFAEAGSCRNAYSVWLDREVVLQVVAEDLRVSLRGRVVNESSNAVRVRIEGCWDVDISKEMIVGVAANNYMNSRIEKHGNSRVAERSARQ
jgi:hypothetical protein